MQTLSFRGTAVAALLMIGLLIAAGPVVAQENDNSDTFRSTTSLTGGYINDSFALASADSAQIFDYDGSSFGIMLSSRNASLLLGYGVQNADPSEGTQGLRNLNAQFSFGGSPFIFRSLGDFPLATYVPIRVNLGFRNLSAQDENGDGEGAEQNQLPDLNEEVSSLNVGKAGLGVGLGASLRIPTDLPVIEDNIVGMVSVVRSVGGMTDFGDVIDGIRLTSTTDFNLEGKLEHLLGNRTGVTVGLTIRSMSWSKDTVEEVADVLDVVTGQEDNLRQRSTQTFFRLGINF